MLAIIVIAVGMLIFAACGDTPTQERQLSRERLTIQKISDNLYDNTVYYGHYRFTDSTGTYDCIVGDNGDANGSGFGLDCEKVAT